MLLTSLLISSPSSPSRGKLSAIVTRCQIFIWNKNIWNYLRISLAQGHWNNHDDKSTFQFIKLTSSMELSTSWEVASRSATQEFPNILWNLKIHCRVKKRAPLAHILVHINPVHATPSYLSKIRFNIVTCRMVRVTKWRVLVRMTGFISSLVTHSFNHTQIQRYRWFTHTP
jgi:hypothetical protein